jgi:quinol monooxygenase YgiN
MLSNWVMNKLMTLLLLALGASAAQAQTKSTTMQQPVTEMVIYQIKAEKIKDFPAILKKVRENVGQAPGFISYKTLQWTKEPNEFITSENTFIDIVEWKTLEAAAEAMKAAEQNPIFAEFFASIERIHTMGHFAFYK